MIRLKPLEHTISLSDCGSTLFPFFATLCREALLRYNHAGEMVGIASSVKAKHRPALSPLQLPKLLRRIDAYPFRPTTRLGLLLFLHLIVRSSELRNARRSEFDFDSIMDHTGHTSADCRSALLRARCKKENPAPWCHTPRRLWSFWAS